MAWFLEWAEKYPMETVDGARRALLEHFGVAFDRSVLAKVMREAKDRQRQKQNQAQELERENALAKTNIPPAAPTPAPTLALARPQTAPTPIAEADSDEVLLAQLIKKLRIKKAEARDDGTVAYEYLPPPAKVIRLD